MTLKKCSTCLQLFTVDRFYKDPRTKSGHTSACRRCVCKQKVAAKKKREAKLRGELTESPDPRLIQKNTHTLKWALRQFEIDGTLVLPTRVVGAPCWDLSGIELRRAGDVSYMDFRAPRGAFFSLKLSDYTVEELAEFLFRFEVEVSGKSSKHNEASNNEGLGENE